MSSISFHKKWTIAGILILLLVLCYFLFPSCKPHEIEPSREKVAPLQEGDTIGILAPAGRGDMAEYSRAIELLESLGYQVKLAPSVSEGVEYLSGTDEDRAKDINDFFADDSIKAILCLRGGYGSARILPLLDYDTIAKHPKLFIGYSDITALHAAIGEKCHMVTIHGPMLSSFKDYDYTAFTLYLFENGLSGSYPIGKLPMPEGESLTTVHPGEASGLLEGGNLTVLASLCGTPYELQGNGSLLFLEDTGVDPYQIDRLIEQLYQNGLLSRVNGILYGDFYGANHKAPSESQQAIIDKIMKHYADLADKPAIKHLPIGHGENNLFLPTGIHATMKAEEEGNASVTLDESYLKVGS